MKHALCATVRSTEEKLGEGTEDVALQAGPMAQQVGLDGSWKEEDTFQALDIETCRAYLKAAVVEGRTNWKRYVYPLITSPPPDSTLPPPPPDSSCPTFSGAVSSTPSELNPRCNVRQPPFYNADVHQY